MRMINLTDPGNESYLAPILYRYDYMAGCPDLSPTQIRDILESCDESAGESLLSFPRLLIDNSATMIQNNIQLYPAAAGLPGHFVIPALRQTKHWKSEISIDTQLLPIPRFMVDDNPVIQQNSVALYPSSAGIPWHTTIPVLRHNKHWASAVSMARKLLTLFSEDDTANTTLRRGSKSYADIAKIELNALDHNWCLFLFYLWPAADERRLELITAAIVFVFIFDDVWEMKSEETIRIIQEEFVACLKLPDPGDVLAQDGENVTPLQEMISTIIRGFEEEDSKCGNGGRDVIKWLIEFINHPPPTKEFETLGEFLDYRIDDAAAQFVFASVKFSLRSSVQMDSPRIKQFMRIASEQLCYANDIGSHDKEKRDYTRGNVLYFINAVDMVKKVFHLPDDDAAKSATLVLQMQTEIELGRELERLRASSDVTVEELEYVESVVYALTGNIFCSVVMSRYGGEATKLEI